MTSARYATPARLRITRCPAQRFTSLPAEAQRHAQARNPRSASLGTVAEWAIVFALGGLGLFWAAGDYSIAVANTQAYKFVQDLPTSPGVVLYSEKA
jgi:hypothetical protein